MEHRARPSPPTGHSDTPQVLLEVRDLTTSFRLDEGLLRAVDGVSFTVFKGRVLGVVGESGCGKSVTAQSILQIVPKPGIVRGTMLWYGREGEVVDLGALNPDGEEMRSIRGNEIAMIFQEPMTAFSPVHTVGNQLMEACFVHGHRDEAAARARAIELLDLVGIPAAARRVDDYTFQLSGGMRQRAMIAMAMMNSPQMLIADEPTTALDVTIQAEILRLIRSIQAETQMAVLYITHDLGVVANLADDVAVMYRGKIVELGTSRHIFNNPSHPYTVALLRSIPSLGGRRREPLKSIPGTVGIPIDPPDECPFGSRCEHFIPGRCDLRMPPDVVIEPGHRVACGLYED
jgi:peptide/nickel transport system ATP-binding protein